MRTTVGLDLASKTGVSIVQGEDPATAVLAAHFVVKRDDDLVGGPEKYPQSYRLAAQNHAKKIVASLQDMLTAVGSFPMEGDDEMLFVVEETNATKGSRYAQKYLEFLHYSILDRLVGRSIVYLSTTTWRSALGVTVGKDGRKSNRKLSEIRDDALAMVLAPTVGHDVSKATKKQVAAAKKSPEFRVLVAKGKLAAGVAGKRTPKHAAVEWVNERFGIALKKGQNDDADAVCVAVASLVPGVKFCDGR